MVDPPPALRGLRVLGRGQQEQHTEYLPSVYVGVFGRNLSHRFVPTRLQIDVET